jgi:hypothetical protein
MNLVEIEVPFTIEVKTYGCNEKRGVTYSLIGYHKVATSLMKNNMAYATYALSTYQ